jgi:hypothetical protein
MLRDLQMEHERLPPSQTGAGKPRWFGGRNSGPYSSFSPRQHFGKDDTGPCPDRRLFACSRVSRLVCYKRGNTQRMGAGTEKAPV